MAKFTDAQSREWSITIDSPAIEAIRENADDKFLVGTPAETFARLENDVLSLISIIGVCCDKQRRERDITEKDFYLGVVGDAIESAGKALLAAVLEFLPYSQRQVLRRAAERAERLRDESTARVLAALEDPKLEETFLAEIQGELDKILEPVLGSK